MTARPSGAFCSPPSPRPSDIGSIPMIIASAVMITGRRRVMPAASAASLASRPTARWSLAKVTTRMLLAVATPTHMIDPISAGTLSVVCDRKSIHAMPAMAPGSAIRMTSGSSQDWKFTTIKQIDEHDGEDEPVAEAAEGGVHALDLPLDAHGGPAGHRRLERAHDLRDGRGHGPEVASRRRWPARRRCATRCSA